MRFAGPIAAALAAMGPIPSFAAEGPSSAIATIAVEHAEGSVTLSGRVLALAQGRYQAQMRIEKSGTAGRTSTTQGGQFTLEAGEVATVATVGLSMGARDMLAVELVLSSDGQEVSRSRLSVGQ